MKSFTYVDEGSESAEVLGVGMGGSSNFPFVLGGLKLESKVSVEVEVSLNDIILFNLKRELVVGEGPVGLGVVLVHADLGLSLSGGDLSTLLPFRLVSQGEGSALFIN